MSTHQQTKPRCANQSITDESGRPGTERSNVGCDAIEEPWTNSTAGLAEGEPTNFSHMKSRTSPSAVGLVVQCSTPVTGAKGCCVEVIADRKRVGQRGEGGRFSVRPAAHIPEPGDVSMVAARLRGARLARCGEKDRISASQCLTTHISRNTCGRIEFDGVDSVISN
jgi:hypothetical protein